MREIKRNWRFRLITSVLCDHGNENITLSAKPILGFSCNHVPKLKITSPSEVLVSSDKRPYRNLTIHNVLVQQGSFFL